MESKRLIDQIYSEQFDPEKIFLKYMTVLKLKFDWLFEFLERVISILGHYLY